MRALSRALLKVFWLVMPLTSCQADYGTPILYLRGKVVDRNTGAGIFGIRIKANLESESTTSHSDGSFSLETYAPRLEAQDVDGSDNGGSYKPVKIELEGQAVHEPILIEMDQE